MITSAERLSLAQKPLITESALKLKLGKFLTEYFWWRQAI